MYSIEQLKAIESRMQQITPQTESDAIDKPSSYIVPPDVYDPANIGVLEPLRGHFMNRVAYGLLTDDDLTNLFSEPDTRLNNIPITYGSPATAENSIDRYDLDLIQSESRHAHASFSALQQLIASVKEKYPTRHATAVLLDLLESLFAISKIRTAEHLLVNENERAQFAQGLSPVFSTEQTSLEQYEHFVDNLNDREYCSNLSNHHPERRASSNVNMLGKNVLAVAISYKHHTTETVKLSAGHRIQLKRALPALTKELGLTHFQIWIDRILSAKKTEGDRTWWKEGLAPYLVLPVLYIAGDDTSDEELAKNMGTMWLNIERVAASIGRGMVSFGRRYDRSVLPLHGMIFENVRPTSSFDWWICPNKGSRTLEQNFKSLLFSMGNTGMLQRETYFEQDREMLFDEACRTFASPKSVVSVIPVTPYASLDPVIFHDFELPWQGTIEWCNSFFYDTDGQPLSDNIEHKNPSTLRESAAVLNEPVQYRKFEVRGEDGESLTWILIFELSGTTSNALAVQVSGLRVQKRGVVVLNFSVDFFDMTNGENSDKYRDEDMREDVQEILLLTEVLRNSDELVSIEALTEDDELLNTPLQEQPQES